MLSHIPMGCTRWLSMLPWSQGCRVVPLGSPLQGVHVGRLFGVLSLRIQFKNGQCQQDFTKWRSQVALWLTPRMMDNSHFIPPWSRILFSKQLNYLTGYINCRREMKMKWNTNRHWNIHVVHGLWWNNFSLYQFSLISKRSNLLQKYTV